MANRRYFVAAGMRDAYVLYTRTNGLGVCRSLSMKGVPVIAIDYQEDTFRIRSKSMLQHLRIPDIEAEPGAAVDALVEIQSNRGEKGILFPASDAFILWASRNRGRLSGHFDMALPSQEVIEAIMDKKAQYGMARRLGIPMPETYFPDSEGDLADFKEDIRYPVLLKPCYSHKWQMVFFNKGFQVWNPTELVERFRMVSEHQQELDTGVMVQRVITGPSTNIFGVRAYIDGRGEAHGVFGAQKVRQNPSDFGIGSMVRTMHNDAVRDLGLRFMKGIGYRGIGSVEFKRDPLDGSYRLMELNARTVKNNILATKAGVNLPWLMYQDLSGSGIDPDAPYPDGVHWQDFIQDCRAYMTLRSRGEITFREWARSVLGVESHAMFDWADPRPCLEQHLYGVRPARELFYVLTFNAGQVLRRNRPGPEDEVRLTGASR